VLIIVSIRAALVIASVSAGFLLARHRASEATNRRELAAYVDGFRVASS